MHERRPLQQAVHGGAESAGALAVNNVVGLPPGAGDIGQVKYRAPLKLDVSMERNMPVIVDAVNRNPLQQSLQRNAEHDEALLAQYLNARA